ncbi:MAG: helix-turn-helix domain-containing protein [Kiritimatiellae bacterium]|nr:helix-turn-helix domain-containing protein [Kiritimatiellia bacterium]
MGLVFKAEPRDAGVLGSGRSPSFYPRSPSLRDSQRFTRAEGVGLAEAEGRAAKRSQEPERKQYHSLSESLQRLRHSPYSKTDQIAHECGFYDQSHFTKMFKHMRGITPGEYRRHHRQFRKSWPAHVIARGPSRGLSSRS